MPRWSKDYIPAPQRSFCPDCGKKKSVLSKFCQKCYGKYRAKDFWSRVDKESSQWGCWIWKGPIRHDGYGSYHYLKKTTLAHRWAYADQIGPIPEGLFLCHRCDNPPCVNPSHLFVGTQADNIKDCENKGRMTYQKYGRAFMGTLRYAK